MPLERASGLFRSEDVELLDVTIPRESASAVVREIGYVNAAQFVDLNETLPAYMRPMVSTLRRSEALERSLRVFRDELRIAKLPTAAYDVNVRFPHGNASIDSLEVTIGNAEKDLRVAADQTAAFLRERNRAVQFLSVLLAPQQFIPIGAVPVTAKMGSEVHGARMDGLDRTGALRAAVAVISTNKIHLLKQVALRLSRGNVLIHTANIVPSTRDRFEGDEDEEFAKVIELYRNPRTTADGTTIVEMPNGLPVPVDERTGEPTPRSVVSVVFSAANLVAPFRRLFASLDAEMYPIPRTLDAKRHTVRELLSNLRRVDDALSQARRSLSTQLTELRTTVPMWAADIALEKAVASQLGMMRYYPTTVKARLWVPSRNVDDVGRAFSRAMEQSSSSTGVLVERVSLNQPQRPGVSHVDDEPMPAVGTIPTWFSISKYTQGFQNIVDSYGTPRYKEVNPAVLTIVTFPFLFGIMFGDVGHGVMLTCIAAYICFKEKTLGSVSNEMFQMMFGGRYMMLFMGIFATYIGILYNDCFGLGLSLFGPSRFVGVDAQGNTVPFMPNGPRAEKYIEHDELIRSGEPREAAKLLASIGGPALRTGNGALSGALPDGFTPYPFGVDPSWTVATNKLDFYNSYKMKQAVILGVVHMLVGVILGGLNHYRNKDKVRLFTMLIPEILFLVCTFGYMDLLIIIKWLAPGDAPSLLDVMTAFFLQPGSPSQGSLGLRNLIPGQYFWQAVLLLVSFASVPVLLIGVPYTEKMKANAAAKAAAARAARGARGGRGRDEELGYEMAPLIGKDDGAHHGGKDESHDFSEIVIHQMIHTIEYVLGCVSNTASYLRLWALSLAHAQLSEVFWQFTMGGALLLPIANNPIVGGFIYVGGFAAWLCVTIGVLLGMEGLGAFLHALRLHWVEFQNKFYAADGIALAPFSIPAVQGPAVLAVTVFPE